LKIGLSFGEVNWGIVGGEHKAFYFRGPAIDQCSESQIRASQQEIILDRALRNCLPPEFPVANFGHPNFFLYTGSKDRDRIPQPVELPPADLEISRQYLPDPVLNYGGLGEFRSVISVFCSFMGVSTHEQLNNFVSIFLEEIFNFSGYFKEVDFGDKGGVLVAFFGAPVSFENNQERALEFVAVLQDRLKALQQRGSLKFRIGITSGLAYTGMVGGEERCQYAAVGNRVNLAARLMTYAAWNEVLVDEEVSKQLGFQFTHKGKIRYKGIRGPVPTFKLNGRSSLIEPTYAGQMIGRQKELDRLYRFITKHLEKRQGSISYVFGEAGIGKSRLAFELRQQLDQKNPVNWFACHSDQILRKPFNAFIYFLKGYFNQAPKKTERQNRTAFNRRYNQLLRELKGAANSNILPYLRELERTRPILSELIGLKTKNSIWDELDAKGRYENTQGSIINLFLTESLIRHTVIELDDAHWMDEDSRELVHRLLPRVRTSSIAILASSRYNDEGGKPILFKPSALKNSQLPLLEVEIQSLDPLTLRTFAEKTLGGPISQEFTELLIRTTNGNPFYLEQLIEYFSESNLLDQKEGVWHIKDASIKLSNSINAILTARIDRLSSLVQETVKAAAVIGREFEVPVLSEVMKNQNAFQQEEGDVQTVLTEQINVAERSQIWRAMNELRYIFKHSLLREVAYDMQLRTRLRELHLTIAKAIEKVYQSQLEQKYVDLAFHYEQAEVADKTQEYLILAADHAKNNYQNQQALNLYGKLQRFLEQGNDRVLEFKTLLRIGQVLELVGQWQEGVEIYNKALLIAQVLNDKVLLGRANNALGHILLLQGNYQDAELYLEIAENFFDTIPDPIGIAKVNGDLGNLFFRQGQYDQAKDYFRKSIQLNQENRPDTKNAHIVASLGLTFMNQGQYDEGIRWLSEQLEVSQAAGDKYGMAYLCTNTGILYFEKGDYDAAHQYLQRGLDLSEELGNKQLSSIAIGCLGSVFERKGYYDQAMKHFQRDLQLAEELGDKQGRAIALNLIGELL
ncbi:MAG: tetratricopeptide repeat protein, partial [Bacteroidota bacterium]